MKKHNDEIFYMCPGINNNKYFYNIKDFPRLKIIEKNANIIKKNYLSQIKDKNICSAGWTADQIRGYPMANGIDWYNSRYSNPNDKGSAHCCKINKIE